MSIFFRYVAKETIAACCVSMALFVAILLSGNAIRDVFEWVASGRLTVIESAKIMAIVLPSVISYALPLGILTGVLITIGKLSSSNEILAMKSVGLSLRRISLPIFLFAMLATALSCLINLYYAPNSASAYRASFRNVLRSNPIRFIKAGEFVDWFPGYVIYVDAISEGKLSGLKIWQLSTTGKVDVFMSAEGGTISYDDGSNSLILAMENGNTEHFDRKDAEREGGLSKMFFFGELSLALPLDKIIGERPPPEKKLRHMNIGELLHARKHWRSNKNAPLTEASIKHDRRLVDMNISSSVAMSFAVFTMCLVAVPLGIKTRRSDMSVNTIVALILALGYYFSMAVMSWFGDKTSLHPEFLVWLPNIFLVALGVKMLRRSARH